jgi:hypothetical protein
MKKVLTISLASLIVIMALSVFPTSFGNAQNQNLYKIAGYVKDANGQGITGCNIIFNVPNIVPSVWSNQSGYYEIYAPAGTYHINVWPPFDSNYISYDETSFTVETDTTNKNITLESGFKISGYITLASGAPVVGASVNFGIYSSGWFSNKDGYYFLSVPTGTYTINARPRTGYDYTGTTTDFPPYYENNFAVTETTIKNITVGAPAPVSTTPPQGRTEISGYILDNNGNGLANAEIIFGVPDIIPAVFSDSTGHYVTYAPAGTYRMNVWPPFDSKYLSYDQPNFEVGTTTITKNITLNVGYKISGYLTDASGAPIRGAHVSLNQYHCGWYSNSTGYYFVTAPAGTYTLTIQPKTGPTFSTYTETNFVVNADESKNFILNSNSTTSNQPSENQKILEIQSNSTVSELAFNNNDLSLNFKVTGPSGTTGYTKVVIAKSLSPNVAETSATLDGKNHTFTVSSTSNYWIMEFTYSHSTHQIVIDLDNGSQTVDTAPTPSQSPAAISTIPEFTVLTLIPGIILASVALILSRKKLMPQKTEK